MSDCGWYSVKGRIDSMEVYQDHPRRQYPAAGRNERYADSGDLSPQ